MGQKLGFILNWKRGRIDNGMLTDVMFEQLCYPKLICIYIDCMKRQRFIKRLYGLDELLNKIAVKHVKESPSVSRCPGPQIK